MTSEPPSPCGGGFGIPGSESVDDDSYFIPGDEAARIASVEPATVRQWATRKKIHRFPGRRQADGTLYIRHEIEAMAASRARAAV